MTKMCMGCMESYGDGYAFCPHCGYADGAGAAEALHMEPGNVLQQRYKVGRVLGYGGFGVTYIGWDTLLEQKVAIKEYLPSEFSTRVPGQTHVTVFNGAKQEQFEDGLSKFIEEARRLAQFHGLEGIVKIFDSFSDNNTAYIIMEYLDGETLAERLKRQSIFSPEEALAILIPVIQSLQIVHAQGIIHRDIAPDNIMLIADGKAKLIDFGAARYATTTHSRSLTVIIKPGYSPEEQYRSRGDQGAHTDVYAIGATLYRMITGEAPPDALERRAFFESKRKDILKPMGRFSKEITQNQETAILNALNVRIEDRTQDMATLEAELTSDQPVVRRQGKIAKIDLLNWPLWAKISVPVAALTVLALSVLFILGVIGYPGLPGNIIIPSGMSRVPSIVNNDMETAERRLDEAILQHSIIGKEYSALVPANLVLRQDISAGSVVMINSVVQISISGGVETRIVPNITGMDAEAVKSTLEEMGYAVRVEMEYSSVFAEGVVTYQDVAGGDDFETGGTITIYVSMGYNPDESTEAKLAVVPNFIGLSYDDAQEAAREAGFLLFIKSRDYSAEHEKDMVMGQSAPAGEEIMTGNTIELVVSLGIHEIKIADVQYLSEEDARLRLEEQGAAVDVAYVASETVSEGLVISQNPSPDTIVSPGETVSLVVSKGGELFAMPNVEGMSETSARSTLSGKGLSVSVNYEKSNTVNEGKVIRQNVAANTSVNRGAKVTLTVSSGQELIKVSNVVGQTESTARNTVSNQGFGISVSEVYSETIAKGKVVSQSPAAGTSQAKGTTIVLTVSKGSEPVIVPDVVRKTQAAAESTLKNLGLVVSIKETTDSSVPQGSVVTQSRTAGTTANKGDSITLSVNRGKEYKVTYNTNGGMGSVPQDSNTYPSGATATVLFTQTPSREGYTFAGWSTSTSGSNMYTSGGTKGLVIGSGDVTLYAVWTQAQTYSVTYNANGGTGSVPTDSSKYASGATVNVLFTPAPSRNGYMFMGWSTTAAGSATYPSGGVNSLRMTNSDVTLYAVWENNEIESVVIHTLPNKTTYYYGDTLDTSGLSLKITYKSKRTEIVTNGFTCSNLPISAAIGQYDQIYVSYAGFKGSYNAATMTGNGLNFHVTMKMPRITSVTIVNMPSKTIYTVGEELDINGLQIRTNYDNGKTSIVSFDGINALTFNGLSFSPSTFSSAGKILVTVTYAPLSTPYSPQNSAVGSASTTFSVTVEPQNNDQNEEISISLTNGTSYTMKSDGTLSIQFVATAPKSTDSHKYTVWVSCLVNNQWEELGAWYFAGGRWENSININAQSMGLKSGRDTFAIAIFSSDNFAAGQSLADTLFYITVEE